MKKTIADKLVKEMELFRVESKEIVYEIKLLQLRLEESTNGHVTPISIEMNLNLVAKIRNSLDLAKINNAGFNKELDIIRDKLVQKRNWFIEQEKQKSSIAIRTLLLNTESSRKPSEEIIPVA